MALVVSARETVEVIIDAQHPLVVYQYLRRKSFNDPFMHEGFQWIHSGLRIPVKASLNKIDK